MRERLDQILKIACFALAALVVFQGARAVVRNNPFSRVSVPEVPTLAAATNAPAAGTNVSAMNGTNATKAANRTNAMSGTNVVSGTNAASGTNVANTTNGSVNVSGTNIATG